MDTLKNLIATYNNANFSEKENKLVDFTEESYLSGKYATLYKRLYIARDNLITHLDNLEKDTNLYMAVEQNKLFRKYIIIKVNFIFLLINFELLV